MPSKNVCSPISSCSARRSVATTRKIDLAARPSARTRVLIWNKRQRPIPLIQLQRLDTERSLAIIALNSADPPRQAHCRSDATARQHPEFLHAAAMTSVSVRVRNPVPRGVEFEPAFEIVIDFAVYAINERRMATASAGCRGEIDDRRSLMGEADVPGTEGQHFRTLSVGSAMALNSRGLIEISR